MTNTDYKAIVMGTSLGGLKALMEIIPKLPINFPVPIIVVQHIHKDSDEFPSSYLNKNSALTVKEANEKEKTASGYVYIAPANYHLLVEDDETFTLSVDAKVNHNRPSIDVLFESAAEVFKLQLIGIILTGANEDGAVGLKRIKQFGGLTIVQDPDEAESGIMPKAAIALCKVDYILSLKEIMKFLLNLSNNKVNNKYKENKS